MMSQLRIVLATLFAVGTISAQTSSAHPAPLDSTLFTTYSLYNSDTNVSLSVCGSTQQSEGCYGGANLGPFGKVGALLESNPSTSGSTVTRSIYVVDMAAGSSGTGVDLYVYKKTDTISSSFDTVSVTLIKTISLPLTGGSSAITSMAANAGYLFIGTNQSQQAVEVKKSTFSYSLVGGFSPPINVSAISADPYGYVTVTFGTFGAGESGFYVFGPNGSLEEDGGGADFMVNTMNSVQTTDLPNATSPVSPRLEVHPKLSTQPTTTD